mmetsp:Transcript_44623/g.148912  ORF Transcript_44623/g.148912 Transcript_44623/m.148912 type:complete len:216 (+) Transcript_44623:141-788(+)
MLDHKPCLPRGAARGKIESYPEARCPTRGERSCDSPSPLRQLSPAATVSRLVVRGAAVLARVHAVALGLLRDAEHRCHLEGGEEDRRGAAHPRQLDDERDELRGEERAAAVQEAGVRLARDVPVFAVPAKADKLGVAEHAHGEDAPEAARAVHREGVEGVVDLELEHELGGAVVHEGADEAGEECGPREHAGAAGGDGDEAGEDAVADHAHVVCL